MTGSSRPATVAERLTRENVFPALASWQAVARSCSFFGGGAGGLTTTPTHPSSLWTMGVALIPDKHPSKQPNFEASLTVCPWDGAEHLTDLVNGSSRPQGVVQKGIRCIATAAILNHKESADCIKLPQRWFA
mmetsp:Transcript_16582/g.26536  ORF Transcript_16582/g.26536 Transcript_16582/m.26536 type:complete len:132 (-) Transcript_16582:3-398(-)